MLGAALIVIGIAILWGTRHYLDLSDSQQLALDTVGATLIAIGVVQLAYDLAVRRAFLAEIYEVTEIKSSLASAGIERSDVSARLEVVTTAIDTARTSIDLVLPLVDLVYERTVLAAITRASARSCQLRIIVPGDASHVAQAGSSQRRGSTTANVKKLTEQFLGRLETDAKTAKLDEKRSSVYVYRAPYHLPALICATESTVVLAYPPLQFEGSAPPYLSLRLDADKQVAQMLRQQIEQLCLGAENFSAGIRRDDEAAP